jgi:phosphoribosylformylglycinamidine synthase
MEKHVARVVVDVMLKPEIADPQGQAIVGAAHRLGFPQVESVRQGKRFEIEVAGPVDDAALGRIREMAGTLLANPVIESYEIHVAGEPAG